MIPFPFFPANHHLKKKKKHTAVCSGFPEVSINKDPWKECGRYP